MNQYLQSTLIENTYLFALLTLVITLYGPRLAPELPLSIKKLFTSVVFRTLVIFLLVFMANKNMKVSIVVTVIFLVIQGMIDKDNALLVLFNNTNNNIAASQQMDAAIHQQVTDNTAEHFTDESKLIENWSTSSCNKESFVGNNVVDETHLAPDPLPGHDAGDHSGEDIINVPSNITMNVDDHNTIPANKTSEEQQSNNTLSGHLENGNVRNNPYPNGPPVCDCNVYPANNIQLAGTAFYPISDNNIMQNMNLDSLDYSQQFSDDQMSSSCLKTLSNAPSQ